MHTRINVHIYERQGRMFGRNLFRLTAHISPLTAIWLMIMFIPTTGRAQLESTMPLAVGNSWSYTGAGQNLTLTVAGLQNGPLVFSDTTFEDSEQCVT